VTTAANCNHHKISDNPPASHHRSPTRPFACGFRPNRRKLWNSSAVNILLLCPSRAAIRTGSGQRSGWRPWTALPSDRECRSRGRRVGSAGRAGGPAACWRSGPGRRWWTGPSWNWAETTTTTTAGRWRCGGWCSARRRIDSVTWRHYRTAAAPTRREPSSSAPRDLQSSNQWFISYSSRRRLDQHIQIQ